MKNLIILGFWIVALTQFSGCSGYQYRKQVIDDQIFQCRELCQNSEVSILRIDGLKCLCNTNNRQPANINNIIIPGVSGNQSRTEKVIERVNYTREIPSNKTELKVRDNAVKLQNARTIYSQVK